MARGQSGTTNASMKPPKETHLPRAPFSSRAFTSGFSLWCSSEAFPSRTHTSCLPDPVPGAPESANLQEYPTWFPFLIRSLKVATGDPGCCVRHRPSHALFTLSHPASLHCLARPQTPYALGQATLHIPLAKRPTDLNPSPRGKASTQIELSEASRSPGPNPPPRGRPFQSGSTTAERAAHTGVTATTSSLRFDTTQQHGRKHARSSDGKAVI